MWKASLYFCHPTVKEGNEREKIILEVQKYEYKWSIYFISKLNIYNIMF